MVEVLIRAYAVKHGRGGRSSKLSMEDMLLATLGYLREYRTYARIAADFGISESILFRAVRRVENTLIKDGRFHLPGKKALVKSDVQYEAVLVEATETPCERPKKQQKRYSGKKKRHTMKTQVLVDKKDRRIICTAFTAGKKHDFKLFCESKTNFAKTIGVKTDRGYFGIRSLHPNSELPHKKSKFHPMSKQEKLENRAVARTRVANEHTIGFVKRFRILSERYRNQRKRFGLRFNLIAAICNLELIC
jgi:transposase-like protein